MEGGRCPFSALRWRAARARLIGAGAFNALPTPCPVRQIGWQRLGVVEAGCVHVAGGRKWLRRATSECLGKEVVEAGRGRRAVACWATRSVFFLGVGRVVGHPGYLPPIVLFMYPRTRMTCSTQSLVQGSILS